MRREVVTITEDVSLSEVARVMLTQKVRRVPIVDGHNKVIGIVARRDVLRGLIKDAQCAL